MATKYTDGLSAYDLGAVIDFMLEVEVATADIIGATMTITIKDPFDNIVDTITADRIDTTGMYVTEWTVPVNLSTLYNTGAADESAYDVTYFHLIDEWDVNGTATPYNFRVYRSSDNAAVAVGQMYEVVISDVNGSGNHNTVQFTSQIPKYYATIDDVKLHGGSQITSDISNFDLVRFIMLRSNEVDVMMKPDVIHNQQAFDAAVRCYVGRMAALDITKESIIGVTAESKKLDTFEVMKQYDTSGRMADLMQDADKCALMILAGGLDTPYQARNFVKGLYDPNRPMLGRGRLDVRGDMPYVNMMESQFLITDDRGEPVEVRGVRTISATRRLLM